MALKNYTLRGKTFQFEEGKKPKEATEVKAKTPRNKSAAPANK